MCTPTNSKLTCIYNYCAYFYRKKSSHEIEFAVSANVAYGEVKLEPLGGGEGGVYEDPEKMVNSGRGNDRQTDYSTDHEYEVTRAAEI